MNGGVNGVPGQGMAQAKQPGEASHTAIATQSAQDEGMQGEGGEIGEIGPPLFMSRVAAIPSCGWRKCSTGHASTFVCAVDSSACVDLTSPRVI